MVSVKLRPDRRRQDRPEVPPCENCRTAVHVTTVSQTPHGTSDAAGTDVVGIALLEELIGEGLPLPVRSAKATRTLDSLGVTFRPPQ